MMIPAERIKELRNRLSLSQEAFGKGVGLSRSEVRNLEYGITQIKDLTIPMLCQVYGVNEQWLRTGEGDVFGHDAREIEISAFIRNLVSGENNFSKKLVSALARLDVEEWRLLESMALKLTEEMNKEQ